MLTVLNGDYNRGYYNPYLRTVGIRGNIPKYRVLFLDPGGT